MNELQVTLFNWNGSWKVPSKILLGNVVRTPSEFLRYCTLNSIDARPTLDQLRSVDSAPNITLTPGGIYSLSNSVIVCALSEGAFPKAVPVKILDTDTLKQLESIIDVGFTHAHNLRNGMVCTIDLMSDIECKDTNANGADQWKLGKRDKTRTGWRVKGYHPLPETVSECKDSDDCGCIYLSKSFANKFKLHTNMTGSNGVITTIVKDGDKLAGTIPVTLPDGTASGWTIKGSVVVREQVDDIVVPEDAIKLKGCKVNDLSRCWVKSLARERINSKGTSFSYQGGQFMPWEVHNLIRERLTRPWRMERVGELERDTGDDYTWYQMIAGEAPPSEYAKLLSWDIDGKRYHNPIVSEIEDAEVEYTAKLSNYAENVIKPTIKMLEEGTSIDVPKVKRAIHVVLRSAMKGLSSPGVKGVWGVLMPYHGSRDVISIPENLWYYLDCPKYVSATRFPIKGKSSIVKLRCVIHKGSYDIRVHHDIIDVVWSGDCDSNRLSYYLVIGSVHGANSVELHSGKYRAELL